MTLCLTVWMALFMAQPPAAQAGQVQLAVAANFAPVANALAPEFERCCGHQLQASSGATGKLYAQIKNGAPFDVFLSADQAAPLQLEQEGLGVKGSRFTYATGRLVLWSAKPGVVDAGGQVLKSSQFAHLAIASPKLAPYGAAALQTLKSLGLEQAWQAKFVQGESLGQTYGFVASGSVDLGFVALSQVYENGKLKQGSMWLVPHPLHAPLHQDAVLLAQGKNNAAALSFLQFLKSDAAKRIMAGYGFEAAP